MGHEALARHSGSAASGGGPAPWAGTKSEAERTARSMGSRIAEGVPRAPSYR
jgi:hypothetical protein